MDFTETPHAEDFMMELSELMDDYYRRGMKLRHMSAVFHIILSDEYEFEVEDDDE